MMKNVLLIDDDRLLSEMIVAALEYHDMHVTPAYHGLDGIEMGMQLQPDVIICDIHLPGIDGFDVLAALRKSHLTCGIPFIFLTARVARRFFRQGMSLGADDYISKPFTVEELVEAINMRLRQHDNVTQLAEQKLNKLQRQITMALSHEFRTPLTLIRGYASLIDEDKNDINIEHLKMIREIDRAGKRLEQLSNKFLQYAEAEFGELPMRYLPQRGLQTTAIIEELVTEFAERFNRNLDLIVNLESATINIIEPHLKTIVQEIIENAFKFSDPGTPVNVTASRAQNFYNISIANQGRGLQPAQIALIGAYRQFERDYYQQPGIGLGLVTAKRLTELYDGRFVIKSVPGHETTVTISLPA